MCWSASFCKHFFSHVFCWEYKIYFLDVTSYYPSSHTIALCLSIFVCVCLWLSSSLFISLSPSFCLPVSLLIYFSVYLTVSLSVDLFSSVLPLLLSCHRLTQYDLVVHLDADTYLANVRTCGVYPCLRPFISLSDIWLNYLLTSFSLCLSLSHTLSLSHSLSLFLSLSLLLLPPSSLSSSSPSLLLSLPPPPLSPLTAAHNRAVR